MKKLLGLLAIFTITTAQNCHHDNPTANPPNRPQPLIGIQDDRTNHKRYEFHHKGPIRLTIKTINLGDATEFTLCLEPPNCADGELDINTKGLGLNRCTFEIKRTGDLVWEPYVDQTCVLMCEKLSNKGQRLEANVGSTPEHIQKNTMVLKDDTGFYVEIVAEKR